MSPCPWTVAGRVRQHIENIAKLIHRNMNIILTLNAGRPGGNPSLKKTRGSGSCPYPGVCDS